MCDDGTYAHQVVVQKYKSGKVKLVCEHTGGQAKAVAAELMMQVQKMIDEGTVNWEDVDVDEVT